MGLKHEIIHGSLRLTLCRRIKKSFLYAVCVPTIKQAAAVAGALTQSLCPDQLYICGAYCAAESSAAHIWLRSLLHLPNSCPICNRISSRQINLVSGIGAAKARSPRQAFPHHISSSSERSSDDGKFNTLSRRDWFSPPFPSQSNAREKTRAFFPLFLSFFSFGRVSSVWKQKEVLLPPFPER